MRISIEIDDALIAETLFRTGLPSVEAVVDAALRDLMAKLEQEKPASDVAGYAWRDGLANFQRDANKQDGL